MWCMRGIFAHSTIIGTYSVCVREGVIIERLVDGSICSLVNAVHAQSGVTQGTASAWCPLQLYQGACIF